MEINEEYLVAFFGKNTDYYLHKWREWQQGRRISFNLAAFFAGLFWFVYRRMYRVAGLILLLVIVEAQVEQWLLPASLESQGRAVAASVVLATIFSAFGNWIYLSYARRKITRILRRETSEEAILRQLRRQGGTSWTLILVCLALGAGLVWLVQQYPQYPQ
jgi:Protein of unknown function (DUF2628)